MKIEILYTNKSRHIKPVAEAMARWVKTYAKSIDDFDDCNCIDLLIIISNQVNHIFNIQASSINNILINFL